MKNFMYTSYVNTVNVFPFKCKTCYYLKLITKYFVKQKAATITNIKHTLQQNVSKYYSFQKCNQQPNTVIAFSSKYQSDFIIFEIFNSKA